MIPRVTFMIAGAQKGGTSALYAVLRNHPDLVLCDVKEPHFFDTEANFRGQPDFAAYHALFSERPDVVMTGEATPDYLWWPPALPRIRDYNPAMRFLILLRHPVDRAYSQWTMANTRGREPLDFEDAVAADLAQLEAATPYSRAQKAYVARGLYSRQLARLLQHFPRDQLHVVKSEDFRTNARPHLFDICGFLGVRRAAPDDQPRYFANTYKQAMDPALRQRLLAFYTRETDAIETLLGWDCSDWRV
jgi:hypothetical protein